MPQPPEILAEPIPSGYCQCECGGKTRIAAENHSKYGHVKGQPLRFLKGHKARKNPGHVLDGATGCWEWQGYKSAAGYGRLSVAHNEEDYAHHWYYERFVGPIPDGLELDHLCRNRGCVNPEHLEPVTHAENMRRGYWAQKTHCPYGHAYDEENTYVVAKTGARQCRTCNRERARKRAAAKS